MGFTSQEPVHFPPDIGDGAMGSSPTSSGSGNDYFRAELNPEIHATEFPFPLQDRSRGSGQGLGLRHSRSRLPHLPYLSKERGSGRDRDKGKDREMSGSDKESKPRHSTSSHSRHSVSALQMILTNERLTQANARNAVLESQKEELLVRFAALVKEKVSLEGELRVTQESLRLHRVQLELAQREVLRANEVVKGVDLARVKAEEEADRLRSRYRHLEAEKMTRRGWEEGWDIGFREGVDRAQKESGLITRFMRRRSNSRPRRREDDRDRDADDNDDDDETERGESADQSTASTPSPVRRARSPSIRFRYRKASIPDTGPHAPPLPIPTLTTPQPLDIPSTQPQQPVPRAPSSSRTRERAQSITTQPNALQRPQSRSSRAHAQANRFEHRSQTSSPEVIRPLPVHSRPPSSPTMSHRSVVPPPDNYIPTMVEGEIPLPPPHELSFPTRSANATPAPSEPDTVRETRGDYGDRRDGEKDRVMRRHMRAMSDVSRASTRISQYDLVSPPPQERYDSGVERSGRRSATPTLMRGEGRRSQTPGSSQQMVEQWRNIITPPPSQPGPGNFEDGENGGVSSEFRSQSPPRSHPGARSRSPRVSGGPRQQRKIVEPTPLSLDSIMPANTRQSPSNVQQIEAEAEAIRESQEPANPTRSNLPRDQLAEPLPFLQNFGPAPSTSPAVGTARRPKTPTKGLGWIKKQFQRSYSSPFVPINAHAESQGSDIDIQIEPPSQTPTGSSSSSTTSPRNRGGYLTPEDANRPIALPNEIISEATRGVSLLPSSTPVPKSPITIRLPDNELPLGFVPMTPVMAYSNPGVEPGGEDFSPIPDNHTLPDPFRVDSPVQRPATANGARRPSDSEQETSRSPKSRAMSFGGHWGWASPDSARLSRPLSLFSEEA